MLSCMNEQNASTATLHAYLSYRDAAGALRWLERAFGFETTTEYPDDQGGIAHAEMRYGGVAFTLFTDRAGYDRPARKEDTVGHGLYVALDSQEQVDAMYEVRGRGGRGVGLGARRKRVELPLPGSRSRRLRVDLRDLPARRTGGVVTPTAPGRG